MVETEELSIQSSMIPPITVIFNGLTFRRNQKSKRKVDREYYAHTGSRVTGHRTLRLHREIWRFYNGEIPEGMAVHHIDGDPFNNNVNNLQLMQKIKHLNMHGDEWIKTEKCRDTCRKNAVRRLQEDREHTFLKKTEKKHLCINCGKEFIKVTTPSSQNSVLYCSEKCKYTYLLYEKTCVVCGRKFRCKSGSKNGVKTCGRYKCRSILCLRLHQQNCVEKTFTCIACGKIFVKKTSYRQRILYCSKECSAANNYVMHKKKLIV